MSKKRKYDFNGTLLNLVLLGGAAVILKKRTGSLRGVGYVSDRNKYINLAMKLYDIAHNNNSYNKTVSFDELGVPFQYYILMDMRHDGFIVLGTTIDRKPGVLLKEYFYNLPRHRFFEEIKNYLKFINYE